MTEEYYLELYDNHRVYMDNNYEPWMTQRELAEMLGVSVQNVNNIIVRALKNGELREANSVINLSLIAEDRKSYQVKHYNLDAILLVGFRTRASEQAIAFRSWVASIVRGHLYDLYERNDQLQHALHLTEGDAAFAHASAQLAQESVNDMLQSIYDVNESEE